MSSNETGQNSGKLDETPQKKTPLWWRLLRRRLLLWPFNLKDLQIEPPLIPGALITLIGLFFLLVGWKVNGVIVCYLGVMALIVAAGNIRMQYIRMQSTRDPQHHVPGQPDSEDLLAQRENAVRAICGLVAIVITGLAIICVATLTVFRGGTATALLWGLGSLFSGGFIGFLFGIPTEKDPPKSKLHINTSLNQINDWLTKIIVGVSLVNAKTAYVYFTKAAGLLGAGLANFPVQKPAATAFAAGLMIAFFFLGFIGTYILMRLGIAAAILHADIVTSKLSKRLPGDEG